MTPIRLPLVRPSFPDPRTFIPAWQDVTATTGQFSNFGRLWHAAAERLEEITGRLAFPCSSGTEALALATSATLVQSEEIGVGIEAFTFEAGRIVAERLCSAYDVIPTHDTCPDQVVIRTIPYGRGRDLTLKRYEHEITVVDAAGAFGTDRKAFAGVRPGSAIAVSFHATKSFPIGEGGAVLLPKYWDAGADAVMRGMNFGFSRDRSRDPHLPYASNAKLDELRCAMILAQLERGDYFAERSARIRKHVLRLIERLGGIGDGITAPYQLGAWQSLVVVGCADAPGLSAGLAERGIASRLVYRPCPDEELLAVDERNLLALPSDCTDDELDHLTSAIEEIELL